MDQIISIRILNQASQEWTLIPEYLVPIELEMLEIDLHVNWIYNITSIKLNLFSN